MIKWIGQHIWDLISRFRNYVYLEKLDSSSETSVLVVDSDGLVTKNSGAGTGMSFVLEDGDGTEVTISNSKEVKFVEGGNINIDWTDTSDGSDADPYDLTFTATDTNTQLTQEQVEDYVGGMVTGNTEVGISVTYQDGDGTLDFDVLNTQDESFTFFASSLAQIAGTSTGRVFGWNNQYHNQLTTSITLAAVPVINAIQASIKACPGPRILYDGKLIIHGVADAVTGVLAIYRTDICEAESVAEGTLNLAGGTSALMGQFNFELKGSNVPVCVDLGLGSLAARTVTDKDIIIPLVYNMPDGEATWTAQAICTLTWKIT